VGNVDAMPKNCHQRTSDELVKLVIEKTSGERARATAELAVEEVERVVREEYERISGLLGELADGWRKRGHELGLGAGIATGHATLGQIGFEGRYDYGVLGPVTNLAARLSDAAAAGQILLSQRAFSALEDSVEAQPAMQLEIKGFSRPAPVYELLRVVET
jgi:adenylate cyclase